VAIRSRSAATRLGSRSRRSAAARREHPGIDQPAQLAGDVLAGRAQGRGRRERVELLADSPGRLEDRAERHQYIERRGPEVAADVLAQEGEGPGVPCRATAGGHQRIKRGVRGVLDCRIQRAVRRPRERERQRGSELADHPGARR
jgi:hypothetical protein